MTLIISRRAAAGLIAGAAFAPFLPNSLARAGRIIFIGEQGMASEAGVRAFAEIDMPAMDPFIAPIVYALPIQMIAYHTALFMGKDVDQPRNLAKSVTVE